MRSIFLILFFLSTSIAALAQFTITGKVINLVDKKPLESATVFLNKTNYGTKTGKDGSFTIYNVQPGHYELMVSMISFKTYSVPISVQSDTKVPTIAIEEKRNQLNEVVIMSAKKPGSKYMDMFKRELLGTSKLGRQCRILNPEVIQLNFDRKENNLRAYTTDFMVIENKALGYRLKYLVEDFERNEKTEIISYVGYVLFETMEGNDQERRDWNKNRHEVYTGSLQHFLRSVIGQNINRAGEPGFLVAAGTRSPNRLWNKIPRQPRYIEVLDTTKWTAEQIAQATDQKGLYALLINNDVNYIKKWKNIIIHGAKGLERIKADTSEFKNALYVTYIKNIPHKLGKGNSQIEESFKPTVEMNKMASLISIFDDHVFFDRNGNILNPMNLKLEQRWAKLRLGDLLPIDYSPDN